MKKAILISIKPEYVNKILLETKKFEYRKVIPKQEITKLIIYSSYPVKQVVGEVEILDIIREVPSKLWRLTKEMSGIDRNNFDKYFKDNPIGYAYKLGKVKVYNPTKKLSDFGIKFAPQSFEYVKPVITQLHFDF